jgi:hypothetical protein
VRVIHDGTAVEVADVLVDTGSASTLLNADIGCAPPEMGSFSDLGIFPRPDDRLRTLRGVGGREVVFARNIERLEVGERGLDNFEVEIGGMDYGFAISGILGMDFLTKTGALINLRDLTLDYC